MWPRAAATRASPSVGRRTVAKTWKPRAASRWAVARPMPVDAPVTTACLSEQVIFSSHGPSREVPGPDACEFTRRRPGEAAFREKAAASSRTYRRTSHLAYRTVRYQISAAEVGCQLREARGHAPLG